MKISQLKKNIVRRFALTLRKKAGGFSIWFLGHGGVGGEVSDYVKDYVHWEIFYKTSLFS